MAGQNRYDINGALLTNPGALAADKDSVSIGIGSTSANCPDLDTSAVAEASTVSKASAGVLYGVTFSNGNAATRYLQFFNSATVPADTTVPVITLMCPAGGTIAAEWPKGRYFSNGISWCNSSTQNTKTIGAADSLADVNYK